MAAAYREVRPGDALSESGLSVSHLTNRLQAYFERHPDVSPERFLFDAVRHEIDAREVPAPRGGPVSDEDVGVHAWLDERLALVDYQRYGLWPRVRRFLANPLGQWMAS